MSNKEQGPSSNYELFNNEALAEQAKEHRDRLRDNNERAVEQSHESDIEGARRELEKATHEREQQKAELAQERSPAERRGPITKRERDASYDKTLLEVRSQMSAPSRVFSAFIHNPTVEKVSDVVGGTVARPNAILAGAAFAFLCTLAIYLTARFYGYGLSGTEMIASLVFGWIVGNLFDYLRLLFAGKAR